MSNNPFKIGDRVIDDLSKYKATVIAIYDNNIKVKWDKYNIAGTWKHNDFSLIPEQTKFIHIDENETFPYQKTFDAIAAATEWRADKKIGISVEKFRKAFNK